MLQFASQSGRELIKFLGVSFRPMAILCFSGFYSSVFLHRIAVMDLNLSTSHNFAGEYEYMDVILEGDDKATKQLIIDIDF